jgi:Zn-dependent metalloprotease
LLKHIIFSFSVFGRSSVDDQGLPLLSSIHFNPKPSAGGYSNAFWNGSQIAFSDGDGVNIGDLSKFLDITAHELVHGVTQHAAKLFYAFQSGALNESMSDVYASMVTQYTRGQNVHRADWLMSKGFYIPHPEWALPSLKAPGTAHARDLQVAHFRNWLVMTTRSQAIMEVCTITRASRTTLSTSCVRPREARRISMRFQAKSGTRLSRTADCKTQSASSTSPC